MNKLISALLAVAFCFSTALAKVPYPPLCTVSPCDALNGVVLCPDSPAPILTSVVTLAIFNQAGNPLANEAVNVSFGAGPLCFCNRGGVDLSDIVTFISGFTPAHHTE